MGAKWIEILTGSLEQKKQYKRYVSRIDALPEPYRAAAKAVQRYFMFYGGVVDGETGLTMMGRPRRALGTGRGGRHARARDRR